MATSILIRSALVTALALAAESVAAGPWTRAVGEGFSSQETRYFRTGGPADERFEQSTVAVYAEYGVTEDVTLGLKLDQSLRLDDAGFGAQSGRIGGFAKIGVWRGEAGDVAAVEIGGSIPLSGFQSPAAPGGDDADEVRGAVLYGRGFETDYGSAWADGALGLAYFTGGRATEAKLDLTAGLRPDENWIGLAQMFATISLRNEKSITDTDFDTVKLKFSVGRKVFEDKTILIGVARDVYARGADPGWEASLTIWSPFDFEWLSE